MLRSKAEISRKRFRISMASKTRMTDIRAAARTRTKSGAPKSFAPPLTVSHADLLADGTDIAFRQSLYLMVLAFSRLATCREAIGRAVGLTGSQFAVLIGAAYRQGQDRVAI